MKCPKCDSELKKNYCIKCGYFNTEVLKHKNNKLKRLRIPKNSFYILIITIILLFISSIFVNDYIKRNRIIPVNQLKQDINSDKYVNDLYISQEYAYEYLLDDEQKELYKIFLNKIKNYESTITLDLSDKGFNHSYFSKEYFIKINDSILIDHPELIHFAYISYQEIEQYKYKINFTYVLNKNEYQKAIKEIKDILNDIKNKTKNMNDYEKIKYTYDWIGKHNKYDYSMPAISQSAYSAFNINLSPVCSGYARASQIILQNIGIDSMIIKGDYNNIRHEWNFVKLDNQYYYYDATSSNNAFYSGLLFSNHKKYHIKYKKLVPMALGKKYIIK